MHKTGEDLLKLMFNDGETICVSHQKQGFHSITQDQAKQDRVLLLSTEHRDSGKSVEDSTVIADGDEIQLVALNPISGWRADEFCTSFRSFLVEMDGMDLVKQKQYIEKLGMPYSAIIFSGSKSLHFLITLSEDLSNEKAYRHVSQWILNIATLADPNTKNPSRSIRIPGAKRGERRQLLVEMKDRISQETLLSWLQKYPNAEPKAKLPQKYDGNMDISRIKPWAIKLLKEGLDPTKGRNAQWYSIACEFSLAGVPEDETISYLSQFYQEDRDFKEKEWKTTICSAYKRSY